MISVATQRSKPYTRLIYVAKSVFDDCRVLTDREKEDFANAICDAIEPYDACYEMGNPNDQWDSIVDSYSDMPDDELVNEYLCVVGYESLEEYIEYEGMPIPTIGNMCDWILDSIDLEEYINDNGIWIDLFFEELIGAVSDENIVRLFADYVKAEVYND